MDIFAISLAAVSGICFGTGVIHLFIGLRRRGTDMKHFSFALFALAYAGAVLTGLLMYKATSLPQYLVVDRWSGVLAGVTYVFLLWFVAIYTEEQPLLFLGALTTLFATLITAHVTRPTLIHGEIMGIASVTLPWGEQITFLEAADSTWSLVFLVAQLLTIGFVFYACIRQYRRGERGAALVLGAGLLLFVSTLVVDFLVESGAIDFVLASDFGFLPLAIAMGLRLSNDVMRTEDELAQHRQKLEVLVENRTAELQQTNQQLVQEIDERTLAEAALRQRAEELAVLNRIAQALTRMTDLPTALAQVSGTVTHLFGARYVHIMLPAAEESELMILVGFEREARPMGTTPLDISLDEIPHTRQVLSQAESLVLSDIPSLPLPAPVREFLTTQNISSIMLVPLVVRGTAIGIMSVATDQASRIFTSDEVRLAETIAADVAGAIESARLLEQAQATAAAEERSRLAHELHDSVTQTLYSISIVAEALPRVLDRDLKTAKRSAGHLRQASLGALAEMRTLLFELRPDALKEASLGTLLGQLGNVLSGRTRVPVEVTVEGKANLPPDVKLALYRIAQEAFNNIARHAGATHVSATLQNLPDRVILTMRDDGRGFAPDSVPAERLGVRFMRERAERIEAAFTIESRLGHGTQTTVEWTKDKGPATNDESRFTTDV